MLGSQQLSTQNRNCCKNLTLDTMDKQDVECHHLAKERKDITVMDTKLSELRWRNPKGSITNHYQATNSSVTAIFPLNSQAELTRRYNKQGDGRHQRQKGSADKSRVAERPEGPKAIDIMPS